MRKRTSTEQSYEPLVTPESWKGDELRFSVRLTQILDGLFARLRAMRAELAGKLGKTEQAADSAKLGGKAPEYYTNPKNLLKNANFREPVNANGFVSGSTVGAWGGETISEWLAYASGATITLTSSGMSVLNGIYQKMEAGILAQYAGKTMTYAAKINGVVYAGSGVIEQTGAWHIVGESATPYGRVRFEVQNDNKLFCIITNDQEATVEWACLYEGSYTAETLPPYVPNGYANELLACNVAEHNDLTANNSLKLGGKAPSEYALQTELSGKLGQNEKAADSSKLGGLDANRYMKYTDAVEILPSANYSVGAVLPFSESPDNFKGLVGRINYSSFTSTEGQGSGSSRRHILSSLSYSSTASDASQTIVQASILGTYKQNDFILEKATKVVLNRDGTVVNSSLNSVQLGAIFGKKYV